MGLYIHRTTRFNKYLDSLCKTGGKGALAAERAELIIENLPRNSWYSPEILSKRTKKGELRVKNCEKYDLGSGYRLICMRKGQHLFFLFIGNHDECDRWLENNRGMQLETDFDGNTISFEEGEAQLIEHAPNESEPEIDEYEEELLDKIDDKALRWVFRGLCKK